MSSQQHWTKWRSAAGLGRSWLYQCRIPPCGASGTGARRRKTGHLPGRNSSIHTCAEGPRPPAEQTWREPAQAATQRGAPVPLQKTGNRKPQWRPNWPRVTVQEVWDEVEEGVKTRPAVSRHTSPLAGSLQPRVLCSPGA
ncbi:hypothetical protein SKAU_G00166380 [Synaphobranchus kaupii]|uniref:Uncharacterized protein n=1 Tax=Synaphobranchus kaupii TaxID=118154 RepID=A0A9Q1FJI8_SYNKA|nr:hypothetical protein SKAU_G00166380 [Synaphobranchus kaupii]